VLTLLRSAAVLDPAAGSGAFLLGAMRVLVTAREAGGETRAAATRAVLRENLHGVDLNPSAVRLAELRLWLEVIEAESAEPARVLSPLPNLDAAIRQGDSLIEPLGLPRLAGSGAATRVRALRDGLAEATGQEKRRLLAALRRAELDAARESVGRGMVAVEARIRELLSTAGSPGLFGDRQRLDLAGRRALSVLRQER